MKLERPNVPPSAHPFAWLAALALAAIVAACGGSDNGNGGPPFNIVSGGAACGTTGCAADSTGGGGSDGGVGSGADGGDGGGGGLGEMRNVKVTARKPDGSVLGSANLLNNLVSIYPQSYKGAFILEFADDGSGRGEYYDEGDRAWTPLAGTRLHVLVPALTHHVSANPLSEAAYQWALNKYGSEGNLDAAKMTEANNTVRDAFNLRVPVAYRVTDVTNYSVAVSDATVPNSLPNTHAGRFGTLLAGLPRAALQFNPALRAGALGFMRQLVKDLKDDGSVNDSVPPADQEAYGLDLPGALNQAISSALVDYGSPQQPPPTAAPSVCFNPALFTVGTKWVLKYDTFNGETTTQDGITFEVTRRTAFGSVADALEVVTTFDSQTEALKSYFGPDISAGLVNYGSVVDQGALGRTEVLYTPPYTDRRFLLTPDSSQTLSLTSVTTVFDGQGNVSAGPYTFTDRQTITFVGFEDVTVSAGTFRSACRYDEADGFGNTTTSWLTSSGQGVLVKSETRNANGGLSGSEVLLPGSTVNGQAVR